jgi:hypothetical protein
MRVLTALVLFLGLWVLPAAAQDQWREMKSETDGFAVMMPATPTITARRIGTSAATQTMFLIDKGEIAYLVSVIQLEQGKGPKSPDSAYYQKLMKDYVTGSKTTLRSTRDASVSGRPGLEGISDSEGSTHLVDLVAVGDRIYMVVYVGAKGQENGPDATRYRESFKIIN